MDASWNIFAAHDDSMTERQWWAVFVFSLLFAFGANDRFARDLRRINFYVRSPYCKYSMARWWDSQIIFWFDDEFFLKCYCISLLIASSVYIRAIFLKLKHSRSDTKSFEIARKIMIISIKVAYVVSCDVCSYEMDEKWILNDAWNCTHQQVHTNFNALNIPNREWSFP